MRRLTAMPSNGFTVNDDVPARVRRNRHRSKHQSTTRTLDAVRADHKTRAIRSGRQSNADRSRAGGNFTGKYHGKAARSRRILSMLAKRGQRKIQIGGVVYVRVGVEVGRAQRDFATR